MNAVLKVDGGQLRLKGPVTVATATSLHREIQTHLGGKSTLPDVVTLDCSEVGTADSAAIALLIEAWRHVSAQGKRLEVIGLREQLTSLARIYGVDWLVASAE